MSQPEPSSKQEDKKKIEKKRPTKREDEGRASCPMQKGMTYISLSLFVLLSLLVVLFEFAAVRVRGSSFYCTTSYCICACICRNWEGGQYRSDLVRVRRDGDADTTKRRDMFRYSRQCPRMPKRNTQITCSLASLRLIAIVRRKRQLFPNSSSSSVINCHFSCNQTHGSDVSRVFGKQQKVFIIIIIIILGSSLPGSLACWISRRQIALATSNR